MEDSSFGPLDKLSAVFGTPPTIGNRATALRNGDEIFPAMLDAIRKATTTIDFLTFVYWSGDIADEFAHALAKQAAAGLTVRVVIDAYGGRPMDDRMLEMMKAGGCEVEMFRPLDLRRPWEYGHRTHRKILVCDGSLGFTGGVGIADEWTGDARNPSEWRDTHVRFEGPVVGQLRAAFDDSWMESTGGFPIPHPMADPAGNARCVVISGGYQMARNDLHTMFRVLIQAAQRRIRLTTAYFLPTDDLIDDLVAAVMRRVETRILIPGEHIDKSIMRVASRPSVERLLDGGIEISTFDPTMLHAKVLTIDGDVSTVGSANFNNRSTQMDEETNVVTDDPDLTAQLDAHFDDDWKRSTPADVNDMADPGLVAQALQPVTEVFQRYM